MCKFLEEPVKEMVLQIYTNSFVKMADTTNGYGWSKNVAILVYNLFLFKWAKCIHIRNFIHIIRSSRPEVFCEKVILEMSQNSQENTYARVCFLIKLQA